MNRRVNRLLGVVLLCVFSRALYSSGSVSSDLTKKLHIIRWCRFLIATQRAKNRADKSYGIRLCSRFLTEFYHALGGERDKTVNLQRKFFFFYMQYDAYTAIQCALEYIKQKTGAARYVQCALYGNLGHSLVIPLKENVSVQTIRNLIHALYILSYNRHAPECTLDLVYACPPATHVCEPHDNHCISNVSNLVAIYYSFSTQLFNPHFKVSEILFRIQLLARQLGLSENSSIKFINQDMPEISMIKLLHDIAYAQTSLSVVGFRSTNHYFAFPCMAGLPLRYIADVLSAHAAAITNVKPTECIIYRKHETCKRKLSVYSYVLRDNDMAGGLRFSFRYPDHVFGTFQEELESLWNSVLL